MEEKNIKETQVYELGYHILPTVSPEDVSQEVTQLQKLITQFGGTIITEAVPVLQQLAYEITKRIDIKNLSFNKAYFGWIKFEMVREEASNLELKIKSLPNVLRFILIKTVKENTLYTPKVAVVRKEVVKPEAEVEVEKIPASEEEIDKSIEALIEN